MKLVPIVTVDQFKEGELIYQMSKHGNKLMEVTMIDEPNIFVNSPIPDHRLQSSRHNMEELIRGRAIFKVVNNEKSI